MELRRKQIYLDPELEERLKEEVLLTGRSESAVIREALGEYLVRKEEKRGAEGHPLARLLNGLPGEEVPADGSEEHDRQLCAAMDSSRAPKANREVAGAPGKGLEKKRRQGRG